jgi:hypothetical protein
MHETVTKWIETIELDLEKSVLAELAIKLAFQYDLTGNTSTAAELRKTIAELRRMIVGQNEHDPIADLLAAAHE